MKLNVRESYYGLIGDANEMYDEPGDWSALRDAFEAWYKERYVERGFSPLRIEGGATPLTSLRVRNADLPTLLSTVGQSAEVDFNIAFGQAIEIRILRANLLMAAITATRQLVQALVDLDGPALAGNSIVTVALFDARKLLDSAIYNVQTGADALTSGAATTDLTDTLVLPEVMLTARNPGVAAVASISTGAALFSLYHKLVEVSRDEQLLLFALGRA